jgi:prepilin-type N-terminal cleavage/methylation domain-containing protein
MRGVLGRVKRALSGRARRGEAGFTLAELIISIAILGIISGALAVAFGVTAHDSVGVADRIYRSRDAQIASAYVATDVQSAKAIVTTSCAGSGTNLINFSADGTTTSVSYFYGPFNGQTQIRRVDCATGVNIPLVKFPAAAAPCIKVDGGACAAAPAAAAPTFKTVTINFTENGTGSYAYSLSGSRRVYINGGLTNPPNAAPYGVLALGSGTGALTLGGNSTLNVNGPVLVNSTAAGAVSNGANGNGGNGIHATGTFAIAKSGAQQGTCSGCSSSNTSPWPNTSYAPIADPFLGLPLPDETGLPVYTDGSYHGPGVYRTKALTVKNSTTTLAAGVYILEAGLDVSGNPSTVLKGTGVLLFNGCGLNAPGSCTNSGTVSVAGQSSLQITPSYTGPYKLLALWQPAANSQQVTISGGASGQFVKGILYAPGSTNFQIGAGGASLQLWSVVGTKVNVTGGGTVTVTCSPDCV